MTELLFREAPYLAETTATVVAVNERNGIVLDRTVFYATGDGQPGDSGALRRGGLTIPIATTVYRDDKREVAHVPAAADTLPVPGETVAAAIDWQQRYRHMRIHTALHLLSVVLPYAVTGGSISTEEGRLDFDLTGEVPAKAEIEQRLNDLVAADHKVSAEWISDDALAANPQLVNTMKVKPPMGTGRVRLIRRHRSPALRGHPRALDRRDRRLAVSKIESKGKQNRRVRIRFAEDTAAAGANRPEQR
jgi:misacylated tRNA(Ala) deacylase